MKKKNKKQEWILNLSTGGVDFKLSDDLMIGDNGNLKRRVSENMVLNYDSGDIEFLFPLPEKKGSD